MVTGDVGADVAAVLAAHADCGIVNVDHGSPIRLTCGIEVPRPGPESTDGWVQIHRAHVADALAPLIAARVEAAKAEALAPVRAILDAWEAWDGSLGPDGRMHPDSSSPRDRDRLRAALDPEGES